MRLWQNAPRQHEVGHTQGAEPHENRSPAPQAAEPGADQRSDRGACSHEQICERQSPRGLMRLRRVADDGAGEDQPRTSAYSLEKAREDERMGIRGEQPGDARDREYGEANQERRPTAKAIGRRTVEVDAEGAAEGEQPQEPERNGGPIEVHRAVDRLPSGASDRASPRLAS